MLTISLKYINLNASKSCCSGPFSQLGGVRCRRQESRDFVKELSAAANIFGFPLDCEPLFYYT